jgi:protein-tyrosine kinase
MGRIADALRKAEEERAATLGLTSGGASATAVVEPGLEETAGPGFDLSTEEPAVPAPREAKRTAGGDADTPVDLSGVSPTLVALTGQDSILVEQYRSLRTRLSSSNPRGRSRVLVITSSAAGEGKSVTTANLGVVMAEVRHHRVLILDADFRRSSLASLFGLKSSPGLIEVLQRGLPVEKAIQRTPVKNLQLISAGDTHGINPAELLSSKRAGAVFDDLRDRYSYVLVDTPPTSDVADAGIVGQMSDGVLLVIRMGKTPQPVVKQIVQTLQGSHVNLVGCVLTGAEDSTTPYNYYYDDNAIEAAG